jgi:hypothetical protein
LVPEADAASARVAAKRDGGDRHGACARSAADATRRGDILESSRALGSAVRRHVDCREMGVLGKLRCRAEFFDGVS